MDPIQEVAEAAARRKQKIREWAKARVDEDKAVTPIDDPLPRDPSPEEVQKVNMQGADETLGGPANEEASEGEAPTYENVDEITEKAEENYPGKEDSEEETAEEAEEKAEDRPADNANKGEWVSYRMKTHNLSEADANEQTKAQLIALD